MTSNIVKYPKDSSYDHVPSHVKVMTSGLGQNRILVQAASDHLEKLSMMAQHLQQGEIEALAERFPAVSQHWLRDLAQPSSVRRAQGPKEPGLRLPVVHGAQPSPRRERPPGPAPAPHAQQAPQPPRAPPQHAPQPPRSRPPRRGRQARGSNNNSKPSPRHGRNASFTIDTRAEAQNSQAFEGHKFDAGDSMLRRLEEAQQAMYAHPPGVDVSAEYGMPREVPDLVLSPGGGSEIGGSAFHSFAADAAHVGGDTDGLWEENPAILAPATLLKSQPIELLYQRREQALDGLRGLLHSLSRVRHAAHRLPSYVAKAYQSRLQHAVGWYRVTTCELVERITFGRRDKTPVLRKTPNGEWRQVHEPFMVDGANVLLLIGRVDLAFAPLPAAADPMLLLWFSTNAAEWVGEGGVSEALLAPSKMHSLLELSRMQRAHEIVLTEAEVWGLSPLPLPYEARDNELGVTFELLLYGDTTRYTAISRRFRAALLLLNMRMGAARHIAKMLRGWIVRSTITAYKAACKVQKIYRKWKAAAHRRAKERTGTSALDNQLAAEQSSGGGGSAPMSFDALLGGGDAGFQSPSRILQRKYGPGGGSAFAQIVQLARSLDIAEKQKQAMLKATAPREEGKVSSHALSVIANTQAAQQGLAEEDEGEGELGAEEAKYRDAATRIQARSRTGAAQKQVLNLAEAADNISNSVASHPNGAQAVASVCKAYRARNAFSMLLLKAFKQRQMAIVMQGADGGDLAVSGVSEPKWRMALEAVRERCMQSLIPAEEELRGKVKVHEEHVALTAQFEKATARLQFWEALKTGTLPAHLSTLNALQESQAIARAEAYLQALLTQRALPLPEGVSPKHHVSNLVGSVKALADLTDALGTEMHELQPLERQLRSHLAHMGVPDPASHETPPPISSNAGRAMLPTQASQNRASSVMQDLLDTSSRSKPGPGGGRGGEGSPPDSPNSPGGGRAKRRSLTDAGGSPGGRASSPTAEAGLAGNGGAAANGGGGAAQAPVPPGEALEDAIIAATSELTKLDAVRELLIELKATDSPSRFQPKLAREAEARREAIADGLRRVVDVESQHEHLSHFVAQAKGTLDLLEAADGFDYGRQRRRLRGEYAQLGMQSNETLRAETDAKKLRDRVVVIESMQDYLENELPKLEKKARERVEAVATLHITLPAEMLDEQLQNALIDDIEDWLGPGWLGHGSRMKVKEMTKAPVPADSTLVHINVLEGAGRSVEELLAALKEEGERGQGAPRRETNCQKVLTTAPQHVARAGSFGALKLDLLSTLIVPAHTIVHDASTLADRKRALEALLTTARAELRPLQAKELVASAAQAQLWKIEGVEEALAQCQNPRLIALKETERAHKPRLIQLAADTESHIERYSEAQKRVLELEARVEALARLITAAAQPDSAVAEAPAVTPSPSKSKDKGRKKVDTHREYSTNAFREVAQNILRERRELMRQQQAKGDSSAAEDEQSKATNQRKYACQGALQLFKTLHREDKVNWKSQPPSEPPSVRLIAHSRFLRKSDTVQRDAIKMMARESARLASSSTPPPGASSSKTAEKPKGGHWAQMKAMIQMAPRKALIDDATIFDEASVQAAAAEMELDIASGLSMLPLVLYFMRSPMPFPFKEEIVGPEHLADGSRASRQGSAAKGYRSSPTAAAKAGGFKSTDAGVGKSISPSAARGGTRPKKTTYRNVISDVSEERHPLRHVYSRLAKRSEKIALKRNLPDSTSPEAWMEFVEPSGTPYYYCFLTRKREWEFPKLVPVGQLGMAVKTSASTHAMRMKHRMLQQPKRRLSPGSLEAMRMNMEAEQRSKSRRAAMLKKMPLPVSHIVFTAQYLGIDPLTQSHLMWLASAALCDTLDPTLPVGWEQRKVGAAYESRSLETPQVYFYNTALRISQWEHPSLTNWRSVLAELLSFERQHLSDKQHMRLEAAGQQAARPTLWVTSDAGLTS